MKNDNILSLIDHYFEFLISKYGFEKKDLSDKNIIHVQYISIKYEVNIFYGPPEFEISFSVGTRSESHSWGKYKFGLMEISQLDQFKNWKWSESNQDSLYINKTEDSLIAYANLLYNFFDIVYQEGDDIFNKLNSINHNEIEKSLKRQELVKARNEAEEAWKRKQFETVVFKYEPIISFLTKTELFKLKYAKERIKNLKNISIDERRSNSTDGLHP